MLLSGYMLKFSGYDAALEAAQKMAARLEGVSCTIAVKTAPEEKLYGSVSVTDITARWWR
jgi:ribosomal protein L9